MEIWKKLNTNEKVMIGFILLMLLMVALNWKRVSNGLEKGLKPYQETPNTEINE